MVTSDVLDMAPPLIAGEITIADKAQARLLGRVLLLDDDAIGYVRGVPQDEWTTPWYGTAANAVVSAIHSGIDLHRDYPDSILDLLERAECFWRTGTHDDMFDVKTLFWVIWQGAQSKMATEDCVDVFASAKNVWFEISLDLDEIPSCEGEE